MYVIILLMEADSEEVRGYKTALDNKRFTGKINSNLYVRNW